MGDNKDRMVTLQCFSSHGYLILSNERYRGGENLSPGVGDDEWGKGAQEREV